MKKINYLLLVFFASILVVGCSQKEQLQVQDESVTLKSASVKADYEFVPNEILIKFKEGTEASKKEAVYAKLSGKVKEKILTRLMEKLGDKNGIDLVSIPGTVDDAIAKAKANPEVEYAEPNYIYHHDATSNDPYFTGGKLWGMAGGYGIQASTAWANNKTGSSSVYVGIIDEGYMYTHVDLAGNSGNLNEKGGDKIDNDGNGYVDDTYGWDCITNDNTVFDGVNDDHGTHVAGTIGAVGGNSKGVAGVCWDVRLIDAKFLGTNGGTTANAIKAVDYFTNLKTKTGINLVATNNSWGGGGYSQGLYDAISRANTAGILFVAAAGNNGTNNDVTASYPSNYDLPNVIAVAAIDNNGALASFSQYGATTVDLGAPGVGIWSTVPVKSGKNVVAGYASYSGTSMATPHVTGAVALYAATKGLIPKNAVDALSIKTGILSSTVSTSSLTGKCVTGGRLNVSGF